MTFIFYAKGKYAVFLGFGSIYNHSEKPNADYTLNIKNRVATFKATENIRKKKEILISYGDKWFSDQNRLHGNEKTDKKNKKSMKKRKRGDKL